MDQFIKSLSVSNSSILDDEVYPCMKIVDWIEKITYMQNKLSYQDVINIAKGTVYLKACYKLYQIDLLNRLVEQYPFQKLQITKFFQNSSYKQYKFVDRVLQKVSQTENGTNYMFMMESLLNVQCEEEIDSKSSILSMTIGDDNCLDLPSNRLKLIVIIRRLFQLPKEQIDVAVTRILDYMPFTVIGHIYSEPENSPFYDSCSIMAQKIYEHFINDSISDFFVKSLYLSSSTSQSHKRFYWQCLKNENFFNGIISFFVQTVKELSKENIDLQDDFEILFYKKHKLDHIFYLMWITLSTQSPCHLELYTRLRSLELSTQLGTLLNKFDSIYE